MAKKILFHGSSELVSCPEYGKGKAYNDYGRGFYCTEHIELAREWACAEDSDGYVNRYEIQTDGLSILNLSAPEYSILNWLAILMLHRRGRLSTPLAVRGREYLIKNFLPAFETYDAIIGYRADDSYFSFARSFLLNQISLSQLGLAMRLGALKEQFVLKSKRAFDALTFLDYSVADHSVYFFKRKSRDEAAREAYRKEIEREDIDGIYLRDLIREAIKPDDPRLQ